MCGFRCYEDLTTCGEGGSPTRGEYNINKSLYPSFIWTSTGFLIEIIILKEILLGLMRAIVDCTDPKCIERSNDQAHLRL